MPAIAAEGGARERRPNFILILADDLGYGDLSSYGHKDIRTPRLDSLAADGVRFSQFYVTSPVCSPTRASFMTGRHPQRDGIFYADLPSFTRRYWLPREARVLPELLQKAGYATAHFGKWHLGEPSAAGWPREHGFDEFFGHVGGLPSSIWGKFSRAYDAKFIDNEAPPRVFPGHVTDVTADAAIAYLDRIGARNQPFYMNIWFNAPHEPLTDRVAQMERFRNRKDLSERQKTYYATIENLDANVGRILDKLLALGILDHTMVLFTSDNGPEEHKAKTASGSTDGLRGMKGYLWEGGIRVPAILRLPGAFPSGKPTQQVASALDWLPTVCRLAKAPIPSDRDEGVDLASLLGSDVQPRTLFFEHHSPTPAHAAFHTAPADVNLPKTFGERQPGTLAIREGDWKLHLDLRTDRRQLFDLAADRWETIDQSVKQTEVVARLEQRLRDWYAGLPKEPPGDIGSRKGPQTEEEADAELLSAGAGDKEQRN